MKITYKNISILHCLNAAWSKRKDILLLLVFILILLSSINVSAQERSSSSTNVEPKILERKAFLANLRAAEQSARATNSNSQHVDQLLSKVQQSVYCYSGSVKTFGAKPTCVYTNTQSLNTLHEAPFLKDNIEMATIRLESQSDLSSSIDLNLFSDFINLKYIQIVSTIPANEQMIKRMVINNDGKYSVFFKIQTGDSE